MVTDQDIRALADKIVAEFHPEKIILFGSRAYGTPREDSDVDLLVVMPFEGSPTRRQAEIRARVHPKTFGLDLILRSPHEVAWRYEGGDPIICEAIDRGIVLYEAAA